MLFSALLKSIFSKRLSIQLWGLEILLFSEFINAVLFYICIGLIMLCMFLVISFDWYNEWIICLIAFNIFFWIITCF